MLKNLSREDRLRVMRFVCSFAWADLEIKPKERALVHKMVKELHLEPDEAKQVEGWLKVPPRAEEVDPAAIPRAHRQMVLDAARRMIKADGNVDPEEQESLSLLEQLLA
ncbi:TerB family tellurite resistance protein [Polyangium spumosum]|uniref:TerB family tellurite resistance protein n=1 Tax=Polyangium spumosum TaxID=889282 RepID=A0A6N7PXY1_9BACT|nr:TerB family tellurite resistance protein [Polyangium spumosum]MRG96759.1 TerB family tellurite resistance protein [Polyangium spumosum]